MSSYLKESKRIECNICGNQSFIDFGKRVNVRCAKCDSVERTRLLWMYIDSLNLNKNSKVLHIAPEPGIYNRLSKVLSKNNYVVADPSPEFFDFAKDCVKIDLCYLDQEKSMKYDLIIHSHVLSYVPCNIAYPLFHFHRMLKKNGTHICIIPFLAGKYDECFQNIGDKEKIRRFGQPKVVRKFGKDDIESHIGSILDLPLLFDARNDFSETLLKKANIPQEHWTGFQTSTVFMLKKGDFRLL
jgi:phosphoglycolate phosphatase